MSYRKAFVGELYIRTHRNFFNSQAPTAREFFDALAAAHNKGKVPSVDYENRSLRLKEIRRGNSGWRMLFILIDPEAPDPSLLNRSSASIRDQRRGSDEDPIFSCHLVVADDAKYDAHRKYPLALENRSLVSKTTIFNLFNTFAKLFLSSTKTWTSKKNKQEPKDFIPYLSMVAPISHTLRSTFENGGSLEGVSIVYEKVISDTHGDASYPVIEERDVKLKVKNKPSGKQAKDILKSIVSQTQKTDPKKSKGAHRRSRWHFKDCTDRRPFKRHSCESICSSGRITGSTNA
jgi:hypothetical protein